jgi:tRNA pseudouridine38-40 synthase
MPFFFYFYTMPRYFLEISYDGSQYHGWQVQPNGISVQEVIEEKLAVLFKQPVQILGSGRTDKGVHAMRQYAHFDCDALPFPKEEFIYKMNRMLPIDVSVRDLLRVKDEAHARFDATLRSYHYHISFIKDPFRHKYRYTLWHPLDIPLMQEAAKLLFNYNDFASFCKYNHDAKTTLCKLQKAEWVESPGQLNFIISSDRFLRNMVRALVGTMVELGNHKMTLEDFKTIIETKDRQAAGFSAPASGLFLAEVHYPDSIWEKES